MTQTGGNPGADTEALLRRLQSRRATARAVLLFEQLWPALWPPLGVAGVFICLALLELPARLPPWLHLALLGGFGVAVLTLLIRAVRSILLPDDAAADRRLERASGLTHRPLTGPPSTLRSPQRSGGHICCGPGNRCGNYAPDCRGRAWPPSTGGRCGRGSGSRWWPASRSPGPMRPHCWPRR